MFSFISWQDYNSRSFRPVLTGFPCYPFSLLHYVLVIKSMLLRWVNPAPLAPSPPTTLRFHPRRTDLHTCLIAQLKHSQYFLLCLFLNEVFCLSVLTVLWLLFGNQIKKLGEWKKKTKFHVLEKQTIYAVKHFLIDAIWHWK